MTDLNILFPGRPNYTGPTSGVFGLLHHDMLFEPSYDVMERVKYVWRNKPKHEIEIRLHNMIYLGGCQEAAEYKAKRDALYAEYWAKRYPLYAEYKAKCDALYAEYWAKCDALNAEYWAKCDALYAEYWAKRDALYAEYEAKRAALYAPILAYIQKHISDCAWNGKELVFT